MSYEWQSGKWRDPSPADEIAELKLKNEKLRRLLAEACSIATTPLPEDRERILQILREGGIES